MADKVRLPAREIGSGSRDGITVLACVVLESGCSNLASMLDRPAHQTTYRLEQCRTEIGEPIFDLRGNHRVDRAFDEAIALELAKRQRQHALADAFDLPPKFGEAPGALVEHRNHQDRPLVPDPVQDLPDLQGLRGIAIARHNSTSARFSMRPVVEPHWYCDCYRVTSMCRLPFLLIMMEDGATYK